MEKKTFKNLSNEEFRQLLENLAEDETTDLPESKFFEALAVIDAQRKLANNFWCLSDASPCFTDKSFWQRSRGLWTYCKRHHIPRIKEKIFRLRSGAEGMGWEG